MDLFQLRAHEGQKIIGEILHTMIGPKWNICVVPVAYQQNLG